MVSWPAMREGRVGNYRIVSCVGEGGMGAVYRAEHVMLGRAAAIKVLLPEFSRSPEMVNRFFNEARATAQLQHPGIIEVFDFGYCDDGAAFIVMELLQGESLKSRLERAGKLPWPHAVYYARQVALALATAHRAQIVHRDLKPDNVFLLPDPEHGGERVKVLDFGIAKLASDTGGSGMVKTRAGVVMGTPAYMSPQQCRGAGEVDHRADIYSLGCMLFEMVCGRPPFVGEGVGDLLTAHMTQPPPMPRSLEPSVSPELEATILRSLAKAEAERQQSMDELVGELDRLLQRPSQALASVAPEPHAKETVIQSSTTLSGGTGQVSAPAAAAAPAGRRRMALVAAGGAVAVLAVVAIVLGSSRRGRDPGKVAAAATAAVAVEPAAPPPAPVEPAPAPRRKPKLAVVQLSEAELAALERAEAKARAAPVDRGPGSTAKVTSAAAATSPAANGAVAPETAAAAGPVGTASAPSAPVANPAMLASLFGVFGRSPLLRRLVINMANELPIAQLDPDVAIRVESKPSGALVTYDGEVIGKTPLSITVERGAYEMELVLDHPGFAERAVTIFPLVDVVERVTLDALVRVRIVTKPPGAEVATDGEVIGVAPLEVQLPRSTEPKTFVVRAPGYLEQEVAIVPAKAATTTVQLEREPQRIAHELESEPPGAEVVLGDQVVGRTPLKLELLEEKGKHRDYLLRMPGDPRYRDTRVRVAADKPFKRSIRLRDVCAGRAEEAESSQPSLVNPYDPCRSR